MIDITEQDVIPDLHLVTVEWSDLKGIDRSPKPRITCRGASSKDKQYENPLWHHHGLVFPSIQVFLRVATIPTVAPSLLGTKPSQTRDEALEGDHHQEVRIGDP
jgi:hypothetical protein